ncbi:MAG: hypothetical protein ACRYGP_13925 [Janthinobacterium lividum]
MSGSATSTLDIILRDDVSPAAKAIAASLEKVEAEAKQLDEALAKSGTRNSLQSRLKSLGATREQIEGTAKAWQDYAKAEGLAMDKAGQWSAKQAAQAKNWENVAVAKLRADRGVERAQAFSEAAAAKRSEDLREREGKKRVEEAARIAKAEVDANLRAAEQEARDRRRIAQQEVRDRRRADEAQHRHEEVLAQHREHAIERQGFRHYALSSAAMAVSAHAIAHVGGEAWEKGAELQHERIGLRNAGRTPEQVREIEEAARATIANAPTASMVESMKVVAETTAAFGSVHHAIENLPFMMKAMSVLKTAGGDNIHGDAASVGQAFAKTFEERQTKPEDFEKEAKAMIPAMVATGGTFNPEQLYMFAQQAKSALPSLSMRFLSKIAPSLIGAQGGERAGTGLNAFESVISGKANDKKQAQEWLSLGLLDPKGVIMKNGQATSWRSGAVKDTKLAMTDPLEWAEKYLIPALKKKGVDTEDREAVKMVLDTMFRNQNSNMFASEITQAASRARLHKDEDLYGQTGQFDEIYKRNLQDFGVASGALKEALGNLASAATAPMMHMAANGLVSLAGRLNQLAELGFQHPNIAAGVGVGVGAAALGGAGWLSYQLMNGFGLGSSAKALDAAAAHLMSVGGGPGGTFNKLPGAIVPAGGGVTGAVAVPAAVEAGAAIIAGGLAVGAVALVKAAAEAQQPGKGGLYSAPTFGTMPLDQLRLADLEQERDSLKAKIAATKAAEKLPGTSDVPNFPLQTRLHDIEDPIRELAAGLDLLAKLPRENDRETRARPWTKPNDYVPLPPVRPADPPLEPEPGYPALDQRTFGAYRHKMEPAADAGQMPAATPPPGYSGPTVDTSSMKNAAAEATETGQHIATALNVTASPKVEMGSLQAAVALAERFVAVMAQANAVAGSAPGRVGAPGPSLASRMRGSHTGNASAIG